MIPKFSFSVDGVDIVVRPATPEDEVAEEGYFARPNRDTVAIEVDPGEHYGEAAWTVGPRDIVLVFDEIGKHIHDGEDFEDVVKRLAHLAESGRGEEGPGAEILSSVADRVREFRDQCEPCSSAYEAYGVISNLSSELLRAAARLEDGSDEVDGVVEELERIATSAVCAAADLRAKFAA